MIFTAHQRLDTAQEFYRDIKARARGLGRNPDHILVMPGVSPFVGRTEAEAREKCDRLTSLILEEDGIALIKGLTGGTLDLTGADLDGPLPSVGLDRRNEVLPGSLSARSPTRTLHHPPAVPTRRQRAGPLHHGRYRHPDRRHAGGVVPERRRRRLQHPAALAAHRPDRFRRPW